MPTAPQQPPGRPDLLVLNTASYFGHPERGLLAYYHPDIGLMSLVAYLGRALPEAHVTVLDPEVHCTDLDALREAMAEPARWELPGLSSPARRIARQRRRGIRFVREERGRVLRELAETLGRQRPRAVAIPFHYTGSLSLSIAAARFVRRVLPECVIIAGGNHATLEAPQLMRQVPELDVIVLGEGELILAELLGALRNGGLRQPVAGTLQRTAGGFVSGPPRPAIADLDAIPHPYTVSGAFAMQKRRAIFELLRWQARGHGGGGFIEDPGSTFVTSRGCPFACSFCTNAALTSRRVRAHSVDYVVEMVRFCRREHDVRTALFADAIFGVSKGRLDELASAIGPMGLIGHCQTALSCLDEERVAAFARLGIKSVFIGVESLQPAVVRRANKHIHLEEVPRAVERLHRHGIHATATFIIGLPGDTRAGCIATARQAREVGFDSAMFFPAVAVRGSGLYADLLARVPERQRRTIGAEPADLLYTAEMSRPELLHVADCARRVFRGAPERLEQLRFLRAQLSDLILEGRLRANARLSSLLGER